MCTLYEKLMETSLRPCLECDPIFAALIKKEINWEEADLLENARALAQKIKMVYTMARMRTIDAVDASAITDAMPRMPAKEKTIIVRNLPRHIDTTAVAAIFEEYGMICDIYLPKNNNANSPYYGSMRGFAIIKFVSAEAAWCACIAGPTYIHGNHVTIEFAKEER